MLRPDLLASHNIRSLAQGIAVARHIGLPQGGFELQMLYGMADAAKQVFVDMGYRLRIYMPYGELIPGMAYLVRRLLENTSNDSFLRATFAVKMSRVEKLIMNPLEHSAHAHGCPPTSAAPHGELRYAPAFSNEPPVDFAIEANRRSMQDALGDVRNRTQRALPAVDRPDNRSAPPSESFRSIRRTKPRRSWEKVPRRAPPKAVRAVLAAHSTGALPGWAAPPGEASEPNS